jgi:hypothetical protein
MKRTMQSIWALLCVFGLSTATADVIDTQSERSFSLAAGKPAIVLKRGDWLISKEQRADTGAFKYTLESAQMKGVLLEIRIGTTSGVECKSADSCLDQALGAGDEGRKEMKRFTHGPFAGVQYFGDSFNSALFNRAEVFAVALAGGCVFEIRVVKFGGEFGMAFGQRTDESEIGKYPDVTPLTELVKSLAIRE